jgi:uncharacterized protein YraI
VTPPLQTRDKISSPAPVAQWTECRPPEPKSAVRVCAGVQDRYRRKAVFVLHYNSFVNRKYVSILLLAVFCAGCGIQVEVNETMTPTAWVITSTLPPTVTPRPSETPLPPPPLPTVAPVEGIASTQVNVRAEPSTASEVFGIIAANTKVEIVGRDTGENWWQIIYPAGVDGKGWVSAQFITTATQPEVPVIGGERANSDSVGDAVIIQQLNVRSGPGTGFNSLGVLNANDVVNLTGKNGNGTWLQIEFTAGPNGRGWVNAGFVRANDVDDLPIVTDEGTIVGTGTPVDTPLPPTPTVVPAPMDNDSADNPIASVTFSQTGTRTLIYNGDVSAPDGDMEDWIAFVPYGDVVFAGIDCSGNGSPRVEIVVGGVVSNQSIVCNDSTKTIAVQKGARVLIHVIAQSSAGGLQYTRYIVTIRAVP